MVVDASVWVSEVVIADAHHARSAVWLERQMASGTALVVPILALSEVAGAVARRSGDAGFGLRAFERLQAFPVLSIVDMDQSLGVAAAEVAATLGLRGADAVYVALAARLRVPLVTLNREVEQRAGGVVRVLQP